MKKKQNAKAVREKLQEQKNENIRRKENERLKAIEAAKAEEERKKAEAREKAEKEKRSRMLAKIVEEHPELKSGERSKVKAAGLKSTFTINDHELVMTRFGRGNSAIPEKRIVNGAVEDIGPEPKLAVTAQQDQFRVRGRLPQDAYAGNPLWVGKENSDPQRPGNDLIGCRDQLEQMYFGKNFEDNIHIQLIYNILDIDKILSTHINNIVYELNNVMRREDNDFDDLIGYLNLDTRYDVFMNPEAHYAAKSGRLATAQELKALFLQMMDQPQLSYFGTILRNDSLRKLRDKGKRAQLMEAKQKESYYFLCLIAMARQALAHGDEGTRAAVYKLDAKFDTQNNTARVEARAVLDRLYGEKVDSLNKNFLERAKTDLNILFRAYHVKSAEQKSEIARNYYVFMVRKQYKNIGFSIRKLREMIELNHALQLKDQKYDTMRAKLNHAFDFVVYDYYCRNAEFGDAMVEQLRAALSEAEKELCYRVEAERLWKAIGEQFMNDVLPEIDSNVIKSIRNIGADYVELGNCELIGTDASEFSKLIYLLTCFLDGKEINDLLTTMISKFESIEAFLSTLKALGMDQMFCADYALFSESGHIARELRDINSFARMAEKNDDARQIMYIEAAELLGFPENEDIKQRIEAVLDKKGSTTSDRKTGFRNFIANNVIESDRFRYLVRYGNAKKLRRLASNRKVIGFVLKDIPDAQILRYYDSVFGKKETMILPGMREALAQSITGISFEEFAGVHQGKDGTEEQLADKERKKAAVRVYLTVLYLLTKNLVYINSRYFLAFHCAERDAMITDPARYKKQKDDYSAFAREYVESHGKNRRAQSYLRQNFANSDAGMVRVFRNCVAHLNAIRNADRYISDIGDFSSYFELYHYLMQRTVIDQYERLRGMGKIGESDVNAKMLGYFALVEKYHTYCKDMVKALNVPFAYNLPRYKNLSIDGLFDRNRPGENGEGKIPEVKND